MNLKAASRIMLILLLVGVAGSFTPQTNALRGTNLYEEVTGLPFHPRVVDVDSKGTIFILSYDQDVWRSTDDGVSWTKVFDDGKDWSSASPVTTRNFLTLFIDNQDNLFVNINTPVWTLYRSDDGGNTWSVVLGNSFRSWHMDESPNGTLWYHTYTPHWATLHKSLDQGVTWTVFWNFTMISEDLRTIAVNDYDDNEVWLSTSRRVMYWNGSAWVTVHYDARSQSYISSIWFDSKYVYLGAEYLGGKKANWRYSHAPKSNLVADWLNYDYYWDADRLPFVPNEHSFHGLRINDIMLFGIRSQLWGSWDGTRWVKIVDLGDAVASDIASISQREPFYFVDKKDGKLYRLTVTKEDLVHLYYAEYLNHRGSRVNQKSYVAEYPILNGTNFIDLTDVRLRNVRVSFKTLGKRNFFVNSGFENGSTIGWTFSGEGVYSVSTGGYEGAFALLIEKNEADVWDRGAWQSYVSLKRGEILTFSVWVKANKTLTGKVMMGLRNQTSRIWAYYDGSPRGVRTFDVTTSWTQIKMRFSASDADMNLRPEFWALKGEPYKLYVDGFQFEKPEVEILLQAPNENAESIEHLRCQPSPYFSGTLDTLNPSLSIGRQSVSHSGVLTNETTSKPTKINGVLTGVIQVDANIQGSGQAVIRITGIRIRPCK